MRKVLTFLGASLVLATAAAAFAQTPPNMFADVETSHWAYQAVESLRSKGIVVGYPDGMFRGKRTLTRYEFAVALDRALKTIKSGEQGAQGAPGRTGDRGGTGQRGPVGEPGMTPAEVATLRRLTQEFKDNLAALGNNMAAVNKKLDDLAGKVKALDDRVSKLPNFYGGTWIGIRADGAGHGYVDHDGRVSPLAAIPGGGAGQAVMHMFNLGLTSNIAGGGTVEGNLVVDNYKNSVGGSFGHTVNAGITSSVPADTRVDTLTVKTPFATIGRESSLTLGRFAHRIGHLTLQKPDVDTYFNVPLVDDGKYRMDGAKLNSHFGSVSFEGFAALTRSVQGTDGFGPINNPYAGAAGSVLFAGGAKPIGQPVTQGQMAVDQLAGITLGLPIRAGGGGSLKVTALDTANTGSAASAPFGAGFGNVWVLGSELNLKLSDSINFMSDFGKTVTHNGRYGTVNAGQDLAWNANLGWEKGSTNLSAGYKYIDPLFYAPGYWGRIGNWLNPTNIQGPSVTAGYSVSNSLGLNVRGDMYKAARNRTLAGGIGGNDNINRVLVGLRWDVAKNFKTTVDWESVYWALKGTHTGIPGIAPGGAIHPTEQYLTFGTGYSLTTGATLKMMYQIGSFDGHGALSNGPTGTKSNFGVFTTSLGVKF